ncbi:MAG: glycerol-3-phosphate 1-O-acyltransferase PlsY [Gammaproteobacteria bacterium]
MLELGYKVFLSYLAGSLNGALLVGLLYGGVDIRKQGSGNAGGTNALRTQGKLFAALVMIVDIGKGVLPVVFLPGLALGLVPLDPQVSRDWLTYACGAAAIFGHCYPVWFEFKGGKGAATTLGVLAAIYPPALIPATITWVGTLFIVGYVGPATVMAGFSIPVYLFFLNDMPQSMVLFTTAIGFFVLYTHRSNMKSLFSGDSEPDVSSSLYARLRKI